MIRETKEIKLPSGVVAKVYTYLTAGEANAVKEIMWKAMKIDVADIKAGKPEDLQFKGQIDGSILIEQEKLKVKYICGAWDTDPQNLSESDYVELVKQINTILSGPLA